MITVVSLRPFVKILKNILKIIFLIILLLYIFPKLISLLWYLPYKIKPSPIDDKHLFEEPLRVMGIISCHEFTKNIKFYT